MQGRVGNLSPRAEPQKEKMGRLLSTSSALNLELEVLLQSMRSQDGSLLVAHSKKRGTRVNFESDQTLRSRVILSTTSSSKLSND